MEFALQDRAGVAWFRRHLLLDIGKNLTGIGGRGATGGSAKKDRGHAGGQKTPWRQARVKVVIAAGSHSHKVKAKVKQRGTRRPAECTLLCKEQSGRALINRRSLAD